MILHKSNSLFTAAPAEPTTVVVNKYKSEYDIYIGRGSDWGNPFTVEQYGREKCIEMYEEALRKAIAEHPIIIEKLMALKGKRLGCFCKPKACHGDVLIKLIEEFSHE